MGHSSDQSDSYTVVIFRGSTAKPLRFNFPRKFVQKALIVGLILLVADLLVISHYIVRTGEVWELAAFRSEALSARAQTAAFSTAVDDLKRRLTAMREINQRLRVMLGIEEVKPGDLMNGQGGDAEPIGESADGEIEDSNSALGERALSNPVLDSGKMESGMVRSSAIPDDTPQEQLVHRVKQEIERLAAEASVQERTLQELSQAAEQRSSRWASTPSIWPVRGWVTSGFGPRISPFTEKPGWHDGLDIGAAPNAPIQAPAAGRVTMTGHDAKMGNVVRLDHGYGVETVYGHLAKALVKEGQRVKRGDVIALVGSTGLSTGPHLHYMVKVNGQAIDPNKYILD
ncbi:MAG TPA: M23 family metallopeptidase [Nitrospiraceae bacterium]|nr:M23 family metallopeptidase [Nitrospiraceae bacterium]